MISEPPPVCKGCGRAILSEPIVQALNCDWHPKCFRCSSCGDRLNNWYIQTHGNIYCRRDYWAKFGGLCHGCLHVMSGPAMVAGEHKYHPECFQCSSCQTLIGDGEPYALVERSFLFCGQCYKTSPTKSGPSPKPQKQVQVPPPKSATTCAGTSSKTPRRKPHCIQMVEIPPTPEHRSLQQQQQQHGSHHHHHHYHHPHHQQLHKQQQQQQQQKETVAPRRLQLSLQSPILEIGAHGGWRGSGSFRNSLTYEGGRLAPCVSISGLGSNPELNELAVGDRILEVNGATVRDKTLEEISSLLSKNTAPVHVMLERDLSPLRIPSEEDCQASPSLERKISTQEAASPDDIGSPSASDGETVIIQDQTVKLRPKNSLRAKGVSPSRRRSKSPSPCPTARQKSIDLSRSHSFSTRQQDHRVFRPSDLLIGEMLGQGFFGQALKATHRVTGEQMVLKELHNFDEDAQKSFLREVSMLRNLSHPCVLKFLGVLYRDKKLNLVTEFIDGGTLSDLLLDHSVELSWKQRIACVKDIAAGMSYLHSMDVIHRDLNSQNCLVRKDQSVVVADFGLAKIFPRHEQLQLPSLSEKESGGGGGGAGSNTGGAGGKKKKRFSRRKRGTVVGNPYWMAPEMMTKGVYDEKVDVFSFGIIVCETIARVTADPDYLPRSLDFGLNVEAFHKKFCQDAPEPYFMLGVLCSQIEPDQRPSFEKIHVLCEALDLHVEHGMAVPAELQGSTVQFYRSRKEEMYGKNYKDVDSCTQANTDKNKEFIPDENQAAVASELKDENQNVADDENDDDDDDDTVGASNEHLIKSSSSSSGSGTGSGSRSSCMASKMSSRKSNESEDKSDSLDLELEMQTTGRCGIEGAVSKSLPHKGEILSSSSTSSSERETDDRTDNRHDVSSHTEDGTADFSVATTTNEDYAYFSCSSSPSLSPSSPSLSTEEFASCKSSPTALVETNTSQPLVGDVESTASPYIASVDPDGSTAVMHINSSEKKCEQMLSKISNTNVKEFSPSVSSNLSSQHNGIIVQTGTITSKENTFNTAHASKYSPQHSTQSEIKSAGSSTSSNYQATMQLEYGGQLCSPTRSYTPQQPASYSSQQNVCTDHSHNLSLSVSSSHNNQNLSQTLGSNFSPPVPCCSSLSNETLSLPGVVCSESDTDQTSHGANTRHQTSQPHQASATGDKISKEFDQKFTKLPQQSKESQSVKASPETSQVPPGSVGPTVQRLTVMMTSTEADSHSGDAQSPILLSPDHERGLSSSRSRLRRSMKKTSGQEHSPSPSREKS